MMISIQSYVRRGRHRLRRWALDPRIHTASRGTGYVLAGFCLSAASLAQHAQPLAMALVCSCGGWSALLAALGAAAGYLVFWGSAGLQGLMWVGAGLLAAGALADRRITDQTPLLLPATAGLIVASTGVIMQTFAGDTTPILIYLLRIALAAACTGLFAAVLQERHPILDWITCGTAVLALAQIVPVPYFALGYIAGGAITAAGAFPAAALAGLALDLAQVTPVPMTAVLCLAYMVRLMPYHRKWPARLAPAVVFAFVMLLGGYWDLRPLPGLLLGGVLSGFVPAQEKINHRRGETGAAQVRLEMVSGVLAQMEQLLLEAPLPPVDEAALVTRAAERACVSCPARKACKETSRISQLSPLILHKPLLTAEELPIICRKSGRFLAELHRSQEQLSSIRANREQQMECRAAVIQQYQFLSRYLQELSDQLGRRSRETMPFYEPQVQIYGNRPEEENGDCSMRFAGTGCRYYVLLCDGMGTGMGAVQEGRTAAGLLRRLLTAGYPVEYALRSLNSLCALRERAGAVTVDLAELMLDTGKVTVYKWGAAPSYLVTSFGAEKLGENMDTLINAVVKAKPAAAKGQYIRSCVVVSTMGPGVKVNTSKYL